jgi:hypothetical protein
MTAKIADIMILDGEAFELHTTPLEGYFERIKGDPPAEFRLQIDAAMWLAGRFSENACFSPDCSV